MSHLICGHARRPMDGRGSAPRTPFLYCTPAFTSFGYSFPSNYRRIQFSTSCLVYWVLPFSPLELHRIYAIRALGPPEHST